MKNKHAIPNVTMHMQTRLFVGNLPELTSEKDLHAAFSSYGQIINLDIKSKSADESNRKNFAFITLAAENQNVETCIKHFTQHEFKGHRLYVTRARESFLERLQRERDNAKKIEEIKTQEGHPKRNPIIKLSEKLNPRKRKAEGHGETHTRTADSKFKKNDRHKSPGDGAHSDKEKFTQKKQDSDSKRMESMKKKRQEFRQKQMIIKTGLIGIDKVQGKKVIFNDSKVAPKPNDVKQNKNANTSPDRKKTLFDENDDSEDEPTFEIKKQFEGTKGQKVLDLQSRYKYDKRFVLDERFIEEESEGENEKSDSIRDENVIELGPEEEKAKQFDILQDLLGVDVKPKSMEPMNSKKLKSKIGMLRFDPTQPQHAKFLAPVEALETKKAKKKKKEKQDEPKFEETEQPKVEVSKEQFYKVSETLKEAIAQPTTFSLRSLFGSNEEESKKEAEAEYIPLVTQKDGNKKIKNPLDLGEKNPFVYDSSDSETEEKDDTKLTFAPEKNEAPTETKAVWKENLFFSNSDYRFKEGIAFFNKASSNEIQKERRELKSLMKKRIYNKERKNQMFQKKIGGRKKTMKKGYRKKM